MRKIIALGTLLILIGCASKNDYQKFDYNNSLNPWINAFKDQMFFACLKESYPNDTIFKLIEKRDAFNPYDGLSLENYNKAKALAKTIIGNIPPPSLCENCNKGQNYYMANCLHYYASKELDSIAHVEYKKYKAERGE